MASSTINVPFVGLAQGADYPVTALPNDYRVGITIIITGSPTEWPAPYGTIMTIKVANARVTQICLRQDMNNITMRTATSQNAWNAWKTFLPSS